MRPALLKIAAAALALTVASAPAHAAGVAVIDATAIAKMREAIATANKHLNTVNQHLATARQMQSSIGSYGNSALGNMLAQSGLNLSGPLGVLRDVEDLQSNVNYTASAVSSVNPAVSANDFRLGMQSFSNARSLTNKIFYLQGNATPQAIQTVKASRQAAYATSGVTGYSFSQTTKGDLTKSKEIVDKLSKQAEASTNLRMDIQANTSVQMALLTEATKQTALLAQMLEIESSRVMAADPAISRR